ncbi:MAG: helix-turn-helix transcriptional regulator [Candidatus Micrarchaeales archaeon]|uniref:Transcriptional regulator, PadR-like family n=1 Tax=Candidatus Micrarchaeum acidiphilum ARMAN-2 TaxID=425595 RepID=C7DH25_MICA2|nr:MAG: transcriptional regulator, PadR-like family [Candidatus Micrarchaeum acidiphilum ARMAN-2]MCW6161416.1 helix-turn-helix transcriptional regulator [Candidatus Micrarchaeales archaeon]
MPRGNEGNEMQNYMTKDMYHLIMKLVILGSIKKKKMYPYELINRVAMHVPKYKSDKKEIKNDVYNTLAVLERIGYIRLERKLAGGRVKNFYTITKKGNESLLASKRILAEAMINVTKQLKG